MPVSLGNLFNEIRQQLLPFSKDLAVRDAEQILEHVIHFSRCELYTQFSLSIQWPQEKEIRNLTSQRSTGRPLPYVLGYTYFHSKKFFVTPDVLIPRPDTEILVETILQQEKNEIELFMDIGTGTGIVAETVTDSRPQWRALAIDVSLPALKIAKKNSSAKVLVIGSDKLSAIKPTIQVDFIASNPPYISKGEMANLDKSVTDYEPIVALDGGRDGLDFYRFLASQCKPFLKHSGHIYCEIGASQEKSVTDIFKDAGWYNILLRNDLANRPRVVVAQARPD